MSSNRDYDLQCLFELLAATVNNEPAPIWYRDPNWNMVYKLADYHNVANVVYGMLLGMEGKRLSRWRGHFEYRFRECAVAYERNRDIDKAILQEMEREKIHCLELEESILRGCYAKKEQHYPRPLTFLVESRKVPQITEAMRRLGFEIKTEHKETPIPEGLWFRNGLGAVAVFYDKLTFTSRKVRKYFSLEPQAFARKKGCRFVHAQDRDDFYIYYMARLAEKYARADIEICDLLDLWHYYQLGYEKMDWKVINKEFKYLGLEHFSNMLIKLAATWFGNYEGFEEDSAMLVDMERYVITKGSEAREENEELLPLVKVYADNYERDLKKEERKKTNALLFPERSYMETIYPILTKAGFLLPFCWVARIVSRWMRKLRNKITAPFKALAEKFKKDKDEDTDNDTFWEAAEENQIKDDENA